MRKSKQPTFRPAVGFKVAKLLTQSVILKSATAIAELSVLSADLFRLRMTSAARLSRQPSWAVIKTDWAALPADIRQSSNQVSIQTARGKLAFHLEKGSWELSDAKGHSLFTAKAGETGFAGDQARLVLSLKEKESLFGLGETTGTFNKRGLIREFWNIDVLGHAPAIHPSLRNLYVSIPFAISLREGVAAGLFWDNTARQTWDLGQTHLDQWQMTAASGEIDLYLFCGPRVDEIVSRYTELTGQMPLPP